MHLMEMVIIPKKSTIPLFKDWKKSHGSDVTHILKIVMPKARQ